MTGFLDLPLELRNHVYELLLWDHLEPQFRGVMVVSEQYVKRDLPLRCYRGILRVCRQNDGKYDRKRYGRAYERVLEHAYPYRRP